MVARPGQYQASLNSGELAPNVWGRSDIKQFYSGASLMVNAEPVPQGGFDGLPGTRQAGRVRGPLTGIAIVEANYNLGPHNAPGTIVQWRFGEAVLDAVDLGSLTATITVAGLLRLEASLDGLVWVPFGAAFSANATARTRRIAVAPGAGVRAQYVRLRLFAAPPGAVTFGLTSAAHWRESAPLPPQARSFEHTYSVEDAFTIDLTAGHADIWKGDIFVAAVATPVTDAMLPTLGREQRLDTMLLFHVDLPPHRIMRRDSDTDWSSDPVPFENIPLFDYGGSYGNVVTDVWTITISFSGDPSGLLLECNVNGEDTAGVFLASGPDWTAFATDLQDKLEDLPSVSTGVTVTAGTPTATYQTLVIVFGGGNNGQRFALVPRITNVTTAAAIASHNAFGDPGGEPIMSTQRGWPATGAFWQDRLYVAGLKSQTGAIDGSVTGEYYDLNAKIENVAGGVLFRIGTRGAERIAFVAESKHMVLFTNEAEYFVSDRAILRGTAPNTVQSSRNGIAPSIRPVENENSLLYVGRSRSIIYAATYSDVSQSYESEPVSLLAPHLIRGVQRAALQRSSESTDAARFWIVREDGLGVVGVMIRNQEVTAFVRFVTDGALREVCVDGANVPYLLVERRVGNQGYLFRERATDEAILHQERVFSFVDPVTSLSGLSDYEGCEIWAFLDGYAHGPFTVAGGTIALPYEAREIVVGRWVAPDVRTLPLPRLVGERTVLQRPVRVHTVRAHLLGATSLAIGANGRPPRDVPLLRGGQVSDQPIQPYHGPVEANGLMGWTDEGIVSFTQLRPGRFRVRDVTLEARV